MSESKDQASTEESAKKYNNILKVRDDHDPLYFTWTEAGGFEVQGEAGPSWLDGDELSYKALRKHIEPWLTALFQSEHLSFLAGSGLTHAVHKMATGDLAAGMSGEVTNGDYKDKIISAADESARGAGREKSNIEDQIRVANELLRGMEIDQQKDNAAAMRRELTEASNSLTPGGIQDDIQTAGGG